MDDEVVLLTVWPSPYGMRVQVALAENMIDYVHKEDDMENKSPLLVEMNPIYKKVPVLIHNGNPICESLNIVEYIDEVWNDKSPLLPSDPYPRAQAKFWADYADKKIFGSARNIWMAKGEVHELAKTEFLEGLKTMEAELGDDEYFGGQYFGFVDLALVPLYSWLNALESCGDFSVGDECPKLFVWFKRCVERESVSKSLTDSRKVYDIIMLLRKKFGIE